jgi:hypothetical protein
VLVVLEPNLAANDSTWIALKKSSRSATFRDTAALGEIVEMILSPRDNGDEFKATRFLLFYQAKSHRQPVNRRYSK